MLAPGFLIADRYRVVRTIGRGATATVYAATHLGLDRQVAVKVFDRVTADEVDIERFRREGTIQARLDHPAILSVLDSGIADVGPFLVSNLVDGPTLATLVRRGELTAERAIRLLALVAEAVDHAHDAGIVHRDLKPSNVIVGPGDQPMLTDFGLARDASADRVTALGRIVGTVAYVAPEVVLGHQATAASDRYSFAVMTWECLTGRLPFASEAVAGSLYAHTKRPPPRGSDVRPELRGANAALTAGLSKSPDRRPTRCVDLIAGVREGLGPETIRRLAPPEPGLVTSNIAAQRRRRRVMLATAVLLLSMAGLLGLAQLDGDAPVAIPMTPPGATALGSDLSTSRIRTVDCHGEAPSTSSPACTVSQASLLGEAVEVPEDGSIVGWHVRGAAGRLRLQVLRERDGAWYRAGSSGDRVAADGVTSFTEELRVLAGDRVGIEMAPGSGVGISNGAGDGTTSTWRWFDPLGPAPTAALRRPTLGEGTGLDLELLLRVDFVVGRSVTQPEQLTGDVAAGSQSGAPLEQVEIAIDGVAHQVVLQETGTADLVLIRDGVRVAVMIGAGLPPGGEAVQFAVFATPDGPLLVLDWADSRSGLVIHREYLIRSTGFERVS